MIDAWLTDRGLSALVFIGFIAMTLIGALLATTTRRLIQSVIGLAGCYFGLAGLIYYLHNPFVSLMVILIYVGAVCVTIVFGIMMAAGGANQPTVPTFSFMTLGGLIAAGALFWALTKIGSDTCWPAPATGAGAGTVQDIGRAFLNDFCLAFELISLVLLVAILGAIVVARGGRSKEP
jgi:NADH-quinone oxidoreductase subunit J